MKKDLTQSSGEKDENDVSTPIHYPNTRSFYAVMDWVFIAMDKARLLEDGSDDCRRILEELSYLAGLASSSVEQLIKLHPTTAKEVFAERDKIPVNYSPNASRLREIESIVKQVELGKNCTFGISKNRQTEVLVLELKSFENLVREVKMEAQHREAEGADSEIELVKKFPSSMLGFLHARGVRSETVRALIYLSYPASRNIDEWCEALYLFLNDLGSEDPIYPDLLGRCEEGAEDQLSKRRNKRWALLDKKYGENQNLKAMTETEEWAYEVRKKSIESMVSSESDRSTGYRKAIKKCLLKNLVG